MREVPRQRWLLATLAAALCGCATPGLLSASEHAARPIPSHSSHASSHHHSHSSGGDASWIGDCLGVLCDASACALDAAANADDEGPQPDDGTAYLDPPDPILVDAAQQPPPPPQNPPPPPSQPLAQPAAAVPQPQPQAVLAVAPSEAHRAQELAADISLAQNQLRSDERAAFVARFSTRADRERVASQPGRDLAAELAGTRSEALLRQLDACHTWGVQLDGDEATCGAPPQRLRWHLEPQGWAIEDLAAPAPH